MNLIPVTECGPGILNDEFGKKYIIDKVFSDICYGNPDSKEYGIIERDNKKYIFKLEGEIKIWWMYGALLCPER